jgi:NADH-quinone oxidoreductase subunit H
MMVRWSWPRFRFDQLMSLAWKVMLPLGLLNLAAVAVISETMQSAETPTSSWVVAGWGWAVLLVGWVGAALAAPLHDDNRPRQNTREFDVEEEMASGAKL